MLKIFLSLKHLSPHKLVRVPSRSNRVRITENHLGRILRLPDELLCEIMGFLLSTEPLYAPTHLRLLAPRHVCRRLRNAAERKIPMTLNASHHPFVAGRNLELTRWYKRFAEFRYFRHVVSFQIDTHDLNSLDLDLLNDFVRALRNCQQARVEIQGPAGGIFLITTSTIPPSRIHSFSWVSATLGVRDPIPVDRFPWRILMDDLPWCQLTHLSLDCPLSDLDAFEILSKVSTRFESISLKLIQRNQNILGDQVALPSLRSLTIDTFFPLRDLLSKLSLTALENLDLKSHVSTEDEDSPLLNQHLNVPWIQLRSLSLSNEDTGEMRRCPVTAILMKCSELERFQWEGPSSAFETSTIFKMSDKLEELIVKSNPQGCNLLLEKLSYVGNVLRRVDISHLMLKDSPDTNASLPHWTHVTVSEGITLSKLSEILNTGQGLTKAAFFIIEGGDALASRISSGIHELEICTHIRTPSLWEWLDVIHIQSVKISFGGVVSNHDEVLDDMAPFLLRYPNLLPSLLISPSPLIYPIHSPSP